MAALAVLKAATMRTGIVGGLLRRQIYVRQKLRGVFFGCYCRNMRNMCRE